MGPCQGYWWNKSGDGMLALGGEPGWITESDIGVRKKRRGCECEWQMVVVRENVRKQFEFMDLITAAKY
jgi:hypothetical protein